MKVSLPDVPPLDQPGLYLLLQAMRRQLIMMSDQLDALQKTEDAEVALRKSEAAGP